MPTHDTTGATRPEVSPREMRRVLLGASGGTALEWFDFALYGAVSAIVFPRLFFPEISEAAGILASFAAFGVGLAARPLGAAIFSNLGDRIGRQRTMVAAIVMMGVASLGIGALPGYATWGITATVLLVVLRAVQGFALGGESSAAQVMALEYAPRNRRGLYGGLVNLGSPLGQVLVAVLLLLLQQVMGEAAFIDWGWRIPFMVGFLLAILGYLIRRHIDETPVFLEARSQQTTVKTPLLEVFRSYPGHVLRLTFLWAANVATSYTVTTYSLDYLHRQLGLESSVGFTLVLITNAVGVFLIPLGGRISDQIGRKPVLYGGAVSCLLAAIAFFPLLDTRNFGVMLLGYLWLLGSQYFTFGVLAALFAEPFPTHVRYSGHAAAYTLTNLIGGAPTPFVAAFLLQVTHTTWSITALLVAAYLVTLAMIRITPETYRKDFHDPANA
jgi:MFS family permease